MAERLAVETARARDGSSAESEVQSLRRKLEATELALGTVQRAHRWV